MFRDVRQSLPSDLDELNLGRSRKVGLFALDREVGRQTRVAAPTVHRAGDRCGQSTVRLRARGAVEVVANGYVGPLNRLADLGDIARRQHPVGRRRASLGVAHLEGQECEGLGDVVVHLPAQSMPLQVPGLEADPALPVQIGHEGQIGDQQADRQVHHGEHEVVLVQQCRERADVESSRHVGARYAQSRPMATVIACPRCMSRLADRTGASE